MTLALRSGLACSVLVAACAFRPAVGAGDDDDVVDGSPDLSGPATCPASYDIDLTAQGFSRYRLATGLPTLWPMASQNCIADRGDATGFTHLVVFAEDGERAALRAVAEPIVDGELWAGLTDLVTAETFRWITDEADPPASGPPWKAGNPGTGDGDRCVRINNAWEYDDDACGTKSLEFVCECDPNPVDPSRF
jgi:hypothetical protein